MAKFQFRERIPIDVNHTLMQLLSRFRGVRDGLPELIKNSKDQYSRLGVSEPSMRVIVIAVNSEEQSLSVIDFAGAANDQFKQWEIWSDPSANTRDRAADIEGGHGNGGKAFMVLGSTTDSSFESCFQGRRTKMGYQNDVEKDRFKPGIALEDGKAVEDRPVESVRSRFERSLGELDLKFKQLPLAAQAAFEARQAYTIARVNGVRDWSRGRSETTRRAILELPKVIEAHPQAAMTLESSSVWFIIDGKVIGEQPIAIQHPEHFSGFEEPVVIPVPAEIKDPRTAELVSTGQANEKKALTLRTSAKSLRTEDLRPLHAIRIRNDRNIVGAWSVADLCPGTSSGFVFGEIRVPVVAPLSPGVSPEEVPLLRGLKAWCAARIIELSDKVQLRMGYSEDERDAVNQQLARFRSLMIDCLGNRQCERGRKSRR